MLRTGMTSFESALCLGMLFKKTLSKLYGTLSSHKDAAEISRLKWQESIKKEITQKDWNTLHNLIRFISSDFQ